MGKRKSHMLPPSPVSFWRHQLICLDAPAYVLLPLSALQTSVCTQRTRTRPPLAPPPTSTSEMAATARVLALNTLRSQAGVPTARRHSAMAASKSKIRPMPTGPGTRCDAIPFPRPFHPFASQSGCMHFSLLLSGAYCQSLVRARVLGKTCRQVAL